MHLTPLLQKEFANSFLIQVQPPQYEVEAAILKIHLTPHLCPYKN